MLQIKLQNIIGYFTMHYLGPRLYIVEYVSGVAKINPLTAKALCIPTKIHEAVLISIYDPAED